MKFFICVRCDAHYEYYPVSGSVVPRCRKCGAYANGWLPLTAEEWYKSFSLEIKE